MFYKSEQETLQNISLIFKSIRKIKDFTQSDLAEILGVSQSYLSKIESANMMPSAYHWMLFCEYFCIHPNSLFSGVIEHFDNEVLVDQNLGPKKYEENVSLSVRFLRPICLDLIHNLNHRKRNEFFKQLELNAFNCILLDYSFGPQFLNDLYLSYKSNETYKVEKYVPKNLNDLYEIHGELVNEYLKSSDIFGLIEIFFKNYHKYDSQVGLISFVRDAQHCEIELDIGHYKQLTDNVLDFYGSIIQRHLIGLQTVFFHLNHMQIHKTFNDRNHLLKLSLVLK